MAEQFKALSALSEYLGLRPGTHTVAHSHLFWGALFWSPKTMHANVVQIDIHANKTLIHKIRINNTYIHILC